MHDTVRDIVIHQYIYPNKIRLGISWASLAKRH
jgi:hypothetical protein